MKLKALLVDDEINIVRNLQKVLPWESIGFDSVETTSDGLKALAYVEEHNPDLILCDIRMPNLDGLGFLQKLNELGKDYAVIMLTGYQDFEYIRTALKYGARDYILKPINYEELENVVTKLAEEIIDKRMEQAREQKKWNSVMNLAYEKLLHDVLLDYTNVSVRQFLFNDEHLLEELEYTLILVDLDEYSHISRNWNEKERKLRNFALRNVLQDALSKDELNYAVLQTREGEWCVVIQHTKGNNPNDINKMQMWSHMLQEAVHLNVKLNVSLGIYPKHASMHELADAYKKVQRSLHLSPAKKQILVLKEQAGTNELNYSMWGLIEEIVTALKQRDQAKMDQAFSELNQTLKAISEQSVLRVEQILHFLILHLVREMKEINVLSDEEEAALWAKLERSISVKDLMENIHQLIHTSMNTRINRKPSDTFMISAKEYINKNLATDFGVEEIADYIGISCSYFSLLFKQQFGETFLEYLTRQRIELAKSILVMSDKSITQIGKMVGYAERRYFTRVFLKFTGMTPTEYREKRETPIHE
ncbi:response regulator [Paenibacillus radicibacter]|uniref:response regulator n=1 Tax=Paenibacillus radicibacter TaxID=2972488 RepID=UPI00215967B7|nr:response regulator [Paenibacillus radicibacter]